MEQLSFKDMLPYIGICTGVAGLLIFFIKRRNRPVWPRDKVILHQFGRGPRAPSISPFCIKLETYLRMTDIPYMNDYSMTRSSKGKLPWITYNDVDVADSHFSIKYLNKKFDVDLNKHLTNEQKAIMRALETLAENNLVPATAMQRWYYNTKFITTYIRKTIGVMGYLIAEWTKYRAYKTFWYEGTGRHNQQEVLQLVEEDLKALSDYLGTKAYFSGSEPCEEDCSLFGVIIQCLCQLDAPIETMLNDKFPNLRDYCERIKARYWPDWDDCNTHNYTVLDKQ